MLKLRYNGPIYGRNPFPWRDEFDEYFSILTQRWQQFEEMTVVRNSDALETQNARPEIGFYKSTSLTI